MDDDRAVGPALGEGGAQAAGERDLDGVAHVLRSDRGDLFDMDGGDRVETGHGGEEIGAGARARVVAGRAARGGDPRDGAAGGEDEDAGRSGHAAD